MEFLCTPSKTCWFSAEVLDNLLQCLPLTRRRLLAKRFDQRCSRKFVILKEAYGPGTDACAIAFEESLLDDEICNICGEDQRMEWWNKDGNIDHSMVPGSYVTGFTMLDFEFFPFPGLEKLQMDRAMWRTLLKFRKLFTARTYVCSFCEGRLVFSLDGVYCEKAT